MRLGVFGGTFNPIHNGHMYVLTEAREHLKLDRLLLIPTNLPPHKQAKQLASDEDRLIMCRLATEGMPWVEVDDREIRRGGLSYTSDTLTELTEDYPGAEIFFLVGSDMFLTIDRWHESERIARLCTVVGFLRRPDTMESLRAYSRKLNADGWKTVLLDLPPLDASSTEIRAGASGLLPRAVEEYMIAHSLYEEQKEQE